MNCPGSGVIGFTKGWGNFIYAALGARIAAMQ
jgi:hypothetical protein